jgi:hypothetical protein
MRGELLVVADCPNETMALEALVEAARQARLADLAVTVTVIDTDDQAQGGGFIGSPTFLVDGTDPFPAPGAPSGVTCRVYPTAAGPFGTPDVDQLRDSLLRACASPATEAGGR